MRTVPEHPLRIALAQTAARARDPAGNLGDADALIRRAADDGAQLVGFPELSITGYDLGFLGEVREAWFTADDGRLDPIRRTCDDLGVTAVLGAPLRESDGAPRLAALIFGADGRVDVWHKQYLHGAEVDVFRAGAPGAPFLVGGWRVSLAICFDAAHPGHALAAAERGTDLYQASALYARGEERRADLHFGARAMDHRMFAALANFAAATGGHHVSMGGSGVWGPDGAALTRSPDDRPALVIATLDPGALRAFRAA